MTETGVNGRGHEILGVFALFEVLCTIVCALRVYTRLRIQNAFGLDDWFAVLAWVLMTIFTAFLMLGVHYGAGQHQANVPVDDLTLAMKSYWFCEMFFISAGMAIKASIGIMLLRLAVSKMHRWIIYISLAVVETYSLVFLLIFIFQCNPSRYFWTIITGGEGSCINPQVIVGAFYGYTAVACITDWTFAVLPAFLVMGLQMGSREKASVILILSMGVLASIASIARIPYVGAMANQDDFLYAVSDTAIWTGVEIGLGVLAACCATLRPLVRQLLPSLGFLSSSERSRSATNPDKKAAGMKKGTKRSSSRNNDLELAGVRGKGFGTMKTSAWHHLEDDKEEDTTSNHSRTMIISAKTSVIRSEETGAIHESPTKYPY